MRPFNCFDCLFAENIKSVEFHDKRGKKQKAQNLNDFIQVFCFFINTAFQKRHFSSIKVFNIQLNSE